MEIPVDWLVRRLLRQTGTSLARTSLARSSLARSRSALNLRLLRPAILLAATLPLSGQAGLAPPVRLSPAQWRQDVAYFARELPARHNNLFFQLSKADFEQQINRLSDAADTATDIEMQAGMARIVASVGAGIV